VEPSLPPPRNVQFAGPLLQSFRPASQFSPYTPIMPCPIFFCPLTNFILFVKPGLFPPLGVAAPYLFPSLRLCSISFAPLRKAIDGRSPSPSGFSFPQTQFERPPLTTWQYFLANPVSCSVTSGPPPIFPSDQIRWIRLQSFPSPPLLRQFPR